MLWPDVEETDYFRDLQSDGKITDVNTRLKEQCVTA